MEDLIGQRPPQESSSITAHEVGFPMVWGGGTLEIPDIPILVAIPSGRSQAHIKHEPVPAHRYRLSQRVRFEVVACPRKAARRPPKLVLRAKNVEEKFFDFGKVIWRVVDKPFRQCHRVL